MASFLIDLIIFIFGASIGSFLNVVIYRLPANLSLIHPPSRCPQCLHPLGKTENIPVFGWLWLKGKCRWCHTSISIRYPFIEALTGLLFVFVFHQFGFSWLTLGYFFLTSWLIALAWIDLDTMTLPNSLTQSGLVLGLIWQCWLGLLNNNLSGGINFLFQGILGAVVGIWLFDAILIIGTIVFGKPAMGGGDPKLMPPLRSQISRYDRGMVRMAKCFNDWLSCLFFWYNYRCNCDRIQITTKRKTDTLWTIFSNRGVFHLVRRRMVTI